MVSIVLVANILSRFFFMLLSSATTTIHSNSYCKIKIFICIGYLISMTYMQEAICSTKYNKNNIRPKQNKELGKKTTSTKKICRQTTNERDHHHHDQQQLQRGTKIYIFFSFSQHESKYVVISAIIIY